MIINKRAARRRGMALLSLATWAAVSAPNGADAAVVGTKYWKNTVTGSWNVAGNWSAVSAGGVDTGGVPVAGDTVNIVTAESSANTRTVTYNFPGPAIALNSLSIEQTGSTTFDVLSMAANALTVSNNVQIGINNNGRGSMSQTGGVNTIGGQLSLGVNTGSTGAYALSNGAYLFAQAGETIGGAGAGTFTQAGSSVAFNEPNDFLKLNNAASVYNLSLGYLYLTGAGSTQAEILNAGTFNQTGGTHVIGNQAINYTLQVGATTGQSAAFNLSSGGTTVDGNAFIGGTTLAVAGTGKLTVNGGTMTILGALTIWNSPSSIVNLSSGSLSADSIDDSSTPSLFNWTGGSLSITGNGGLGIGAASSTRPLGPTLSLSSTRTLSVTNALTIDSGANFTLSSGTLTAGSIVNTGTGIFTWTGGTITMTGASGVTIGSPAPFSSGLTLTSTQVLNVTNALTIPTSNTLTLSSGTLTVGSIASSGTLNWNGGTIAVTGTAGLTLGGNAPFGSSVNVDSTHGLTVSNTLTIPTGSTLNLSSGTLKVGSISYPGNFNWTAGTLVVTGPGTNLTTLNVGSAGGETLSQTGGNVTTGSLTIAATAGTSGTMTLNSSTTGFFTDTGDASVGGTSTSAGGTGTLNVQTASTMNIAGTLKLYVGSNVNLSAGTLSVGSLDTSSAPGTFNWTAGTLSVTGSGGLGLGTASSTRPLGTTLSLSSTRTLNVTNAFTIDSSGVFTLTTGTLTVGSLANNGGSFTWTGGTGSTINITGTSGASLGVTSPFTSTLTVDTSHTLTVANTLTIPTGSTLTLSTGSLSVGSLSNSGNFNWTGGTFTQTGSGTLPLSTVAAVSGNAFILAAGSTNITVTSPTGTLTNSSGQFQMDSPSGAHDVTFSGNIVNSAGAMRIRGGGGGARVVAGYIDNFSLIVFNNADGTDLTTNALTIENGSQDWVNLGSPGLTNTINVLNGNGSGGLSFAGTVTVNLSNGRNDGNQGYGAGTYPLFHYVGTTVLPTFATTLSSTAPTGFSYSYINDPTSGNVYLDVIPTNGESWNGTSSANWSGSNWTGGAAPSSTQLATFPTPVPASGSTITVANSSTSNGLLFNDSYTLTGGSLALSNGMVDVAAGKTVTIATTLNGVSAYSSLGLLKSGVGNLILTGPNTYTGTTVADTGTITAGAANTFPAVGTLQASGGTLSTGGFDQTVSTVVLSAGNININGGTVKVTNGIMVNAASGAGHINLSGGTLSTPSYQTNANKTSLNWTGGTLQLTGTGSVPITTVPAGTTLSLNPIGSNIIVTGQSTGGSGPAKPSVISIPSPASNSNPNRSGAAIDAIVIHTTESSYASTVAEFLTPNDLSVNYVNDTDGSITEMVDPATGRSAFHGSQYNDRSIGIETVGYADRPSTWNSSNMSSLENLVAYLAYTYNVPVLRPSDNSSYNYLQVQPPGGGTLDEPGILAHAQFQPWNRYDPGYYFDWTTFISTVQSLIANSISPTSLTNNGTINVTNTGNVGVTYRGDIINVGTFNVTNTNLTMTNDLNDFGTVNINGGSSSAATMEMQSGSILNVPSGSLNIAGTLHMSNTATVHLTGGTLAVGNLDTGGNPNSIKTGWTSGTLDITNSPLNISSAGPLGNSLTLGNNQTLIVATSSEFLGSAASDGTVTQNSATSSNQPLELDLGDDSGTHGYYILSAGALSVPSSEYVGLAGQGTMTQSGGTNTTGQLNVGYSPAGTGLYLLSGTGSLHETTAFIGAGATGTFNQSGGSHIVSADLNVGWIPGVSGTYLLSGTGALSAQNEYVGGFGAGTFTQSGGTNSVTGTLTVAWQSGSTGLYSLNGGSLKAHSLAVNTNGLLKVMQGAGEVLSVGTVTTPGGKIDLTDNKMIVTAGTTGVANASGVYPANSINRLVHDGRNTGNWDGAGIITTMTAANLTHQLTTLGVAAASDALSFTSGTKLWSGQTVSSTDVLVKYTYAGDANLDGKVNADDYFQIDSHYNKSGNALASGSGFFNGDFNYDGKIDGGDYFLIDQSFHGQGTPFSSSPLDGMNAAPGLSGVSAVPEPVIAPLGLLFALGTRRRRC